MIRKSVRSCAFLLLAVLVAAGVPAAAQDWPAGWNTQDIGSVGAAGTASGSGGAFTAEGAGADIWGYADAFRFVYTTLTGDGSVVTRVTSEEYVHDWTKAGVMMRETLNAGSRHALLLVSPGKGLAFQRRAAPGGASTNTAGGPGIAPCFLKLTRAGNTITAAKSADGVSWTTVGADTITMGPTIYVGLAVSSHVAGNLATAIFESTAVTAAPPAPPTTNTLVFLRHAEKPAGGYGQLTCQGLQRALALPSVLTGLYGRPQYIFAPNPMPRVTDVAGSFSYVRPLATIEPTAINSGLPVNAEYGYTDIAGLQAALLSSTYASSTVFVAWEHLKLQQLVQNIMNAYGGGAPVPAWPADDFDSLYVVRLTQANGVTTAQFTHDYEGLNGLSTACP